MKTSIMAALMLGSSTAWAAPGAFGLTLDIEGAAIPGTTMTFTVSGAAPGQTVFIGGSTLDPIDNNCPAVLRGLCLNLDSPVLLGQGVADGNGEYTVSRTVPNAAPGTVIQLQAAAVRGGAAPATSLAKAKLVPNAAGSLEAAFGQILFANLVDGTGAGFDFFSVFSTTAGLTTCYLETETTAAPLPPLGGCPACEFAWAITPGATFEGESAGGCEAFYGFDVSTPALNIRGLGIDTDYGTAPYPVAWIDYGTGFVPFAAAYWNPAGIAYWTYGYTATY